MKRNTQLAELKTQVKRTQYAAQQSDCSGRFLKENGAESDKKMLAHHVGENNPYIQAYVGQTPKDSE